MYLSSLLSSKRIPFIPSPVITILAQLICAALARLPLLSLFVRNLTTHWTEFNPRVSYELLQ
jgi:hypothetical protein